MKQNKIITPQQIEAVLGAIYQTNITAQTMDALKKFFIELPNEKVEVPATPVSTETQG